MEEELREWAISTNSRCLALEGIVCALGKIMIDKGICTIEEIDVISTSIIDKNSNKRQKE